MKTVTVDPVYVLLQRLKERVDTCDCPVMKPCVACRGDKAIIDQIEAERRRSLVSELLTALTEVYLALHDQLDHTGTWADCEQRACRTHEELMARAREASK